MKKIFVCGIVVLVILVVALLLSGVASIDSILHEPKQTAAEFLDTVPHIYINDILVTQPSSSVIVFAVGLASLIAGLFLLFKNRKQKSRLWCALAFIFLGFSAIFAGISYQAFTYQIKCMGREFCVWTSWWEIVYLIFTVMGMSCMTLAQSYLISQSKMQKVLRLYPFISLFCYLVIILIGIMVPIKLLISFELLVVFLLPNCLVFVLLNVLYFFKTRKKVYLHLLVSCALFGLSVVVYFFYMWYDVSEILWSRGIWFNENDVLHSILFVCVMYIAFFAVKHIKDYSNSLE